MLGRALGQLLNRAILSDYDIMLVDYVLRLLGITAVQSQKAAYAYSTCKQILQFARIHFTKHIAEYISLNLIPL